MSTQFFSKLSQNYIELLEDNEYYDLTVEVGEDPNVKIFRAHMNILCHRSPYLRRILSSNTNKSNNGLINIQLPNISSGAFKIILRYIYGGILSLNEQDTSEIFNVLLAADELLLQELVDHLQKYLIENKSEWMEQHFEFTHRTSFQFNSLIELQQFCTDFMVKSPEKIFKSLDFISISEKSLVQFIKRDDLQMREIEVWEHVLKWGLAQNSTLKSDPTSWSDDDFKTMENILHHCLPLIRFFSLSSKEFLQKVRPYKKLLKCKLYEDLEDSYMDPDIKPNENILLPRNIEFDGIINSNIVNLNIVSIISRWIDKIDVNNNFSHLRELYLPYKFELLFRGSQEGFDIRKFHELCDGKPNTVTFIKLKDFKEILGGYNPLKWTSLGVYDETKDSFIFSFKNDDIKTAIISNVQDAKHAVANNSNHGPQFGNDIFVFPNYIYYNKNIYDKMLRDTTGDFTIEDYEVFRTVRR
ncbi:hypothetical protein RclHR1_03710014 [Rhizophagus clarus]|uniref:BTB domain-containing protein n=1 Tax=Rhizophagus clarus TaxID=94130 RepID=A0A2Z6RSR4_9GLOM|nr:hypothetical protein RclHR1_03710014 [Rhizophagus clarus]GES93545.1 hypothetical protein GLOIN_2v1868401 [Rhizophagus clarus]